MASIARTKIFIWVAAAVCLAASLPPSPASAQVPDGSPTDLPLLSAETPRGGGEVATVPGPAPTTKIVDGAVGDWIGEPSRYGGTAVISAGEYIYQDHLFDPHGPDDGRDSRRIEATGGIEGAVPEAYRLDALAQADPAGQLGVPSPEEFSYDDSYGDAAPRLETADLHEVRLAIGGDTLSLLARTTTMTANSDTALLLLADTVADSPSYEVPFNSGLITSGADVAAFIAHGRVLVADLASGAITPTGTARADASGWTNALEASLPLATVSDGEGRLSLAAATGRPNPAGDGFMPLPIETSANDAPHANVANVAFRFGEPVRTWFDKNQALALHDGTIDPFFTSIDPAALAAGLSQTYTPGHGYHDRIFISDADTGVPREGGRDGLFQHYGVYLPASYDGSPAPLQWWLHWRGGDAHTAGAVVPKVFKQYGEDRDSIVVSPSGRGTSTWYVGRGHVDIRQVWSDVFGTFAVDRDHVYVTGHSMGGWGSYLLTLLYPDRFAAAAPVAGPVTQGAWTGLDFDGCDEFEFDGNTPCYIEANESRPRDQHTRKLLENARHVPFAIMHGTDDELVPYSGVFRQAERLTELGYRYRLYTYPGYEHYSHPIADQWAETASYLHSFTRPENPAQVTYKRDMPFERATEEVQSGGATLNFDFDSAYWMSGLTPADMAQGTASFDGRSLAIPETPHLAIPDSGAPTAPGQTGPYVITGLQWIADPSASETETSNAFEVDVTGTAAVTLDVGRMGIESSKPITGTISGDHPLDLGLAGNWEALAEVLVDGRPVEARLQGELLRVSIPAGDHELRLVQPQPTAVAFTESSDDGAQHSDLATLEARLVTEEGMPVVGQTLSFTLGSSSVSGMTDENGIASVDVVVGEGAGTKSVSVSFAGVRDRLFPTSASDTFAVSHEDSEALLTVTGKGSAMGLQATLFDKDSAAGVAGRQIPFFANDQRIGEAITDASGVARFALAQAKQRHPGLDYTATFAGDDFFLTSSDSATRD